MLQRSQGQNHDDFGEQGNSWPAEHGPCRAPFPCPMGNPFTVLIASQGCAEKSSRSRSTPSFKRSSDWEYRSSASTGPVLRAERIPVSAEVPGP